MASLTVPPIASIVADGSLATYTLSIPAGSYPHLKVITEVAGTTGIGLLQVQFNGDTGSNYSTEGTGNRDGQTSLFWGVVAAANSGPASVFISDIPLFASTTFYKYTETRSLRNDSLKFASAAVGGRWLSTAAITSITFTLGAGGNFAAGSRIDVYAVGDSIPAATSSTLGVVQVGSGLAIDTSGVLSNAYTATVQALWLGAGSALVTIPSGSSSATGAVTFPTPYGVIPVVVACGADTSYLVAVQSPGTTGFTAKVGTRSGSNVGVDTVCVVYWHATVQSTGLGHSVGGSGGSAFSSYSAEGAGMSGTFSSHSVGGSGSS